MATACSCAEPPIAIQRLTWWLFPATAFHAIYPATGPREGLSFPDGDFEGARRQISGTGVLRQLDRAQLDSGRRRTIEPGSCLVGAPSDSAVSQARLPYRHFAEPRSISDRLRWNILVNAHGHVHTPGAPPGCHNDSRME